MPSTEPPRPVQTRWEHGGFFEFPKDQAHRRSTPWGRSILYRTGTDALRGLLSTADQRGWRRLLVPTYYCQGVIEALRPLIQVDYFDDGPTRSRVDVDLDEGDVVLAVEYFGAPHHVVTQGGSIVVDRSHDPLARWDYDQPPEFAIASLRKTLPVPDGGALWSPAGRMLPQAQRLTAHHIDTASDMLQAMQLRRAYLDGEKIDKPAYLALKASAERRLFEGEPSRISDISSHLLEHLPIEQMRPRRDENRATFLELWPEDHPWLTLFDTPAFIILLAATPELRDALRSEVIAADVYPAVLWDLTPAPAVDEEDRFSRTMLAFHTDVRYGPHDMTNLVDRILRASARVDASDVGKPPR